MHQSKYAVPGPPLVQASKGFCEVRVDHTTNLEL